jgi:hypothetical protein
VLSSTSIFVAIKTFFGLFVAYLSTSCIHVVRFDKLVNDKY